jgi:hypothetical protein
MNAEPNENAEQQKPIEAHLAKIDAKLVKIQDMQEKILKILEQKPAKPAGFATTAGIFVGEPSPFASDPLPVPERLPAE